MQQKIETAGLGQTFQMKCPKHKEEQLRSSKIVKVRAAGSAAVTRDPLFYCSKCDAYYMSRQGMKKESPIATYKDGKPVYVSSNVYTLCASWEKPVQKKTKPAASKLIQKKKKSSYDAIKELRAVEKAAKKKEDKKQESPKEKERCARIHLYTEEEFGADRKLGNLLENFCLVNQNFADFKGDLNTFIKRAIPEKISQKCRICAITRGKRDGHPASGIELYLPKSSFIHSKAGKNSCLALTGYLKDGEFFVEDFWVEDQAGLSGFDYKEDTIIFYYDGPNKLNILYDYLEGEKKEKTAKPVKPLSGELAAWDHYLDWKKQLAQRRIQGIKYIGLKIDA